MQRHVISKGLAFCVLNVLYQDCSLFYHRHPTAYAGMGVFLGTKVGASFGGVLGPLGALFGGAAGYGLSYLASKLTCPKDPNQQPPPSPASNTRGSRKQNHDL